MQKNKRKFPCSEKGFLCAIAKFAILGFVVTYVNVPVEYVVDRFVDGDNHLSAIINLAIWFCVLFCTTMFLSYKQYDDSDLVSKRENRLPTEKGDRQQIIFVFTKLATAMAGGALVALFDYSYALKILSWDSLADGRGYFIWVPQAFVVYTLIGIFQNIIRHFQGRTLRSIFEIDKIRNNLKEWRR